MQALFLLLATFYGELNCNNGNCKLITALYSYDFFDDSFCNFFFFGFISVFGHFTFFDHYSLIRFEYLN